MELVKCGPNEAWPSFGQLRGQYGAPPGIDLDPLYFEYSALFSSVYFLWGETVSVYRISCYVMHNLLRRNVPASLDGIQIDTFQLFS